MRTGRSLTVLCRSLLPGGGCLLQGMSAPGGCVSASWGGWVSGPGGYPSVHWGRHPPPHLWTESQTPVKTLPWPNFIAAGKNLYLTDNDVVSGNPPGKPIVRKRYTGKPLHHLASTQHHRWNQHQWQKEILQLSILMHCKQLVHVDRVQ